MRFLLPLAATLAAVLCGCGGGSGSASPSPLQIVSVTPSTTDTPNSVATFGNYEFVSVQGTGQIFTYSIASGSPVLAVPAYFTACNDPSGMVIATIGGNTVMAAACFDTSTLLTLSVHSDGSLSRLGSVSGLPQPFPGIVLDGANVLVPLFGQSGLANGSIARVSIASPSSPVITGSVTLASPGPGQFVNPGYLAVASGTIYAVAGSENSPQTTSSTIQVVNESTMSLLGSPFPVAHSPQQIAVQGSVAYVTLFDASQLESINIANPASLAALQIAPLAAANSQCNALPIAVSNQTAYVGCYNQGYIEEVDVSNPSNMRLTQIVTGIAFPQRILPTAQNLLVTSSITGGQLYQIDLNAL